MLLTDRHLLDVWERSAADAPVRRSLSLLGVCWRDATADELVMLRPAERDARLVAVREQLFGDRIDCFAVCPACGGEVEFSLTTSELVAAEPPTAPPAPLRHGAYEISCRLPTCADLIECIGLASAEREDALLQACIVSTEHDGQRVDVASLPASVRDALAAHLAAVDDRSLTELSFTCPSCGVAATLPFDITSHLWIELGEWAQHVLEQVHVLASAYGWTEDEILSLSPWRRRRYLELIER